MTAVVLTRHDEPSNMHRFYALDVQPDLFGAECLIIEWGRIGQSGGECRSIPYPTLEDARTALQRQQRAKQRKGYM
jgi:predicted DNA-binding WGR domain protein